MMSISNLDGPSTDNCRKSVRHPRVRHFGSFESRNELWLVVFVVCEEGKLSDFAGLLGQEWDANSDASEKWRLYHVTGPVVINRAFLVDASIKIKLLAEVHLIAKNLHRTLHEQTAA